MRNLIHPPNLTNELRRALRLRTPFWDNKLAEIGTNYLIADRLMIGVLPIHIIRRKWFRPAQSNDKTGMRVFVMPTSLRDGQHVIDLVATNGEKVWQRLGTDDFLGYGEPVRMGVGDWLRAEGDGSVYLRGCHE